MKPMHMTAIGTRDENRHYYTLIKESLVEEPLNEIMQKIGWGPLYYGKERGDSLSSTYAENHVERIVTGEYDIDIIYTHNRIILIVRAPREQQKIFKELMLAYSKLEEK